MSVQRSMVRVLVVGVVLVATVVVTTRPNAAEATRAPQDLAPVVVTCADGRSAADLHRYFSAGPAGLHGVDYQRALTLPDGRVLWTFQDAFVRTGAGPVHVHNVALVQTGSCFELRTGPDVTDWLAGPDAVAFGRWYWPLDAEVGADGNVHVFVADMIEEGPEYLSVTTPVAARRIVLRLPDLAVIANVPAADPSTMLHGWSIVSDADWTYLYGQCHRQFGHGGIPWVSLGHDASCSARVTVGRVPRGRLWEVPSYWDGRDWQRDRSRAVGVIPTFVGDRARSINPTQVWFDGDGFVAVTKDADWWGDTIHLDRAPRAQGPWTTYHSFVAPVRNDLCNTYFASFVPWREPDGSLIVGLSNNRWDEPCSVDYRPSFFTVPPPPRVIEPAPVPPIGPADPARFEAVAPCRLVDTREDAPGRLAAGTTIRIDVTGRCDVPLGATSVALSITATEPAAAGYLTVHPDGAARPLVSNLNVRAGQTRSNGAIVRLSADGAVAVFTSLPTHLVVDVTGAFLPAAGSSQGRFVPTVPRRLLDTRSGGRPAPGTSVRVALPPEVPADATAVAATVTTTESSGFGFFTAHPAGTRRPWTSILTTDAPGQTRAVGVLVPVSSAGLDVSSSAGDHVIVDLLGYVTGPSAPASGSGLYVGDIPARLFDSRHHVPSFTAGATRTLDVGTDAAAVVLTATMTRSWGPGYVTITPSDAWRDLVSTVNVDDVDATAAALTVVGVSPERTLAISSSVGTDVIVDRSGWFTP